jgi:DNA replication and repair protein RecF
MFLKQLKLTNFRNYSELNLNFDDRPTILLGNNAVGKSNMLESIYFLSTTKSQRVETEAELIKEGENFSLVSADLEDTNLEIGLQNIEGQFSKRVKVNGVPRRVVDFVGNLPAVIFYPSDINIVTGPPSLRRWHLDLGLAQVDSEYKKFLTLFEQVVTNRNRILKRIREGEGGLDELTYWTQELIKDGQVISKKRRTFFEFITRLEKPLGNFEFKYHESVLSTERLDQYSSREIAAANTLIGPHRDDFTLDLNGKHLAHFGSRGEQRTSTLAFKLAQLEYMAQILGTRPILLLDDVFSELDAKHRGAILEIVGQQQTIIATVELEHIPKKFLNSARVLKVDNGKITE